VRLLEQLETETGGHRKASQDNWEHASHVGMGLADRCPRLQPREGLIAEVSERGLVPIEAQGHDQWRVFPGDEMKIAGQHANHFARLAVDQDAPAQDAGIAAKLPAPVAVGQEHGIRAAGRIVLAGKPTAEHGRDSEDRQDAISDQENAHQFGVADAGYIAGVVGKHADILEGPVLLAINEIVGRRRAQFLDIQARGDVPYSHQIVGLRIGQRLQQHALEHAENGRIGAHADSQGDERDRGEHGRAAEPAEDLVELR
jgi:hypothetical protein